jgi:DNA-binding CsgD family transcriptional regulator
VRRAVGEPCRAGTRSLLRAHVHDRAGRTVFDETARQLRQTDRLRRRGRGERQRPQIGWASLTPVERDVVRLVAEGHTNAEIGQRLFMSVNTVKKHLSRVYSKLDVDGRADLAAQVARRDL